MGGLITRCLSADAGARTNNPNLGRVHTRPADLIHIFKEKRKRHERCTRGHHTINNSMAVDGEFMSLSVHNHLQYIIKFYDVNRVPILLKLTVCYIKVPS